MNMPPPEPVPPTPGEGSPVPPAPEVVDEAQVSFFQVAKAGLQSFALNRRARQTERVETGRARAVNEALQANLDLSNRPIAPTARDRKNYLKDIKEEMQRIRLWEERARLATVGSNASELGGRVASRQSRKAQEAGRKKALNITDADERILAFARASRIEAMLPSITIGEWPDKQKFHIVAGSTSGNVPLGRSSYEATSREEFEEAARTAGSGRHVREDSHIPALQVAQDQAAAATERYRNILTPDQVAVARRVENGRALVDRRIGRSQQLERRENITDRLAGRADDAQRNHQELAEIRDRQVAARKVARAAVKAARNAPPADPDEAA